MSVMAAGNGPLFSVHSSEGAVLAEGLDANGLATQFPDLGQAYGAGIARLDARLDRHALERFDATKR
jgi:hypothetical protein